MTLTAQRLMSQTRSQSPSRLVEPTSFSSLMARMVRKFSLPAPSDSQAADTTGHRRPLPCRRTSTTTKTTWRTAILLIMLARLTALKWPSTPKSTAAGRRRINANAEYRQLPELPQSLSRTETKRSRRQSRLRQAQVQLQPLLMPRQRRKTPGSKCIKLETPRPSSRSKTARMANGY